MARQLTCSRSCASYLPGAVGLQLAVATLSAALGGEYVTPTRSTFHSRQGDCMARLPPSQIGWRTTNEHAPVYSRQKPTLHVFRRSQHATDMAAGSNAHASLTTGGKYGNGAELDFVREPRSGGARRRRLRDSVVHRPLPHRRPPEAPPQATETSEAYPIA